MEYLKSYFRKGTLIIIGRQRKDYTKYFMFRAETVRTINETLARPFRKTIYRDALIRNPKNGVTDEESVIFISK